MVTAVQNNALADKCGWCGAEPGERCVNDDEAPRAPHACRVKAAKASSTTRPVPHTIALLQQRVETLTAQRDTARARLTESEREANRLAKELGRAVAKIAALEIFAGAVRPDLELIAEATNARREEREARGMLLGLQRKLVQLGTAKRPDRVCLGDLVGNGDVEKDAAE